jgi:hypothetical protein
VRSLRNPRNLRIPVMMLQQYVHLMQFCANAIRPDYLCKIPKNLAWIASPRGGFIKNLFVYLIKF